MKAFSVLFVPVGIENYDKVTAKNLFERSSRAIKHIWTETRCPDHMLCSAEQVNTWMENAHPDLIIYENITFANGAFSAEAVRNSHCPVLVWALKEPAAREGFLTLNSLTGMFSAGNTLHRLGVDYEVVYGAPEDDNVLRTLNAAVQAARLICDLQHARIASIGHTPQGFGFGRAMDHDLFRVFGITLECFETRELISAARKLSKEEIEGDLAESRSVISGLDMLPEQNVLDFGRLYHAYKEIVRINRLDALASRCWPDFFTDYGTPVCAVLAMLNAQMIPAACEADVNGALSMLIGMKISGKSVFFGDPVSIDESENTITFWHCGTGACNLARKAEGVTAGVQFARKLGPTVEFGCESTEHATVLRVGQNEQGSFRMIIMSGAILDKPKQYCGVSAVVQLKSPVTETILQTAKEGWEPHFTVLYGDYMKPLKMFGKMLGIEVTTYGLEG